MVEVRKVTDSIYMVQRIERLPFTIFFILIALVTGFGLFFDIFDIDTMSATIAVVKSLYHLNAFYTTLTIAMAFIGMFVGSLVSGYLADKFGRRSLFMITLAIIAIGSFLTALSTNIYEIWAFRFITGFGIGGDIPVVWAYLTEMSPSRYRGMMMGIAMIIGVASLPVVGILATYFISHFPVVGWRYVFIVGAVIAVLVWAARYYAPESPRYYLAHGNPQMAERILSEIENRVKKHIGKELPPYDTSKQYVLTEYRAPLRELFRKDVIAATTAASLLWIFQTWGFYGFTAFLPLILIARGVTLVHAILYTAIGWAGGILGPVVVAALGERFERRYALAIYAAGAAIFALALAFTPINLVPLILLFAFLVNLFIQAWAATLYTFVPELFPTRVRGTGGGFANAMGRGFNVIGLMVVGVALAGMPAAQLTFVALSWLACIIVLLVYRVKTSGKVLEEISEK